MSIQKLVRKDFELLDQQDPLASFRELFHLPIDSVYLDGNSLGVMPLATVDRMNDVLKREWAEDLIRSWNDNHWFEAPLRIGDKIAQLIGADDGEVIATDSVSINLFKLMVAALNMQKGTGRKVILSEAGNFPTDLYMMEGLKSMLGDQVELVIVDRDHIEESINEDVAVVLLTDVHYKTGHLLNKKSLTERAHKKGALVIWDLCHSAGALPVDLNGISADMAVGCGYKYLNGGPGAPAFLFVAKRHQAKLQQPLSGWWGHARPFAFVDEYEAGPGISSMLCSTQGVLGLSCLEVSIDLFLKADMQAVRNKSVQMCNLFIRLLDEKCSDYNFEVISPLDSTERGSQVSFAHEQGYPIVQAMIDQKVIGDFRAPNVMRFGFTPLYLKYVDVWQAVIVLEEIMQNGTWDQEKFKRVSAVT
ncbi:MAG: kynureninase [Arenicella sp.]|nr:kynureninase [Arenicella sp.]